MQRGDRCVCQDIQAKVCRGDPVPKERDNILLPELEDSSQPRQLLPSVDQMIYNVVSGSMRSIAVSPSNL